MNIQKQTQRNRSLLRFLSKNYLLPLCCACLWQVAVAQQQNPAPPALLTSLETFLDDATPVSLSTAPEESRLTEKGAATEKSTVTLRGTILNALEEDTLDNVAIEILMLKSDGRMGRAYTGLAHAGRFAIPLAKEAAHILILRKPGFEAKAVLLEASTENREHTFQMVKRTTAAVASPATPAPETAAGSFITPADACGATPSPETVEIGEAERHAAEMARRLLRKEETRNTEPAAATGEVIAADSLGTGLIDSSGIAVAAAEQPGTSIALTPVEATEKEKSPVVQSQEVEKQRMEEATDAEAAPVIGYYNLTAATSFRKEATHRSGVMVRFEPGDQVAVLEKTNVFWWRIRYDDREGYVKARLLEPSGQ